MCLVLFQADLLVVVAQAPRPLLQQAPVAVAAGHLVAAAPQQQHQAPTWMHSSSSSSSFAEDADNVVFCSDWPLQYRTPNGHGKEVARVQTFRVDLQRE